MADVDQTFTGSVVLQVLNVDRSFTASIDPGGIGDFAPLNSPMPATGLSIDSDNLDGMNENPGPDEVV